MREKTPSPPRVNDTIPVEVLDRYLADLASDADRAQVARWVRYADHTLMVEQLREIRPGAYHASKEVDLEGVVQRLMRAGPEREHAARYSVSENTGWSLRQRPEGFGKRTLQTWMSLIGVSLMCVCAILLLHPIRQTHTGTTRTYVTRSDEQATVTASDGTQFLLSPNTTLRLIDFGIRRRLVEVDGEAYVIVAHASGQPFIVRSGNVNLQVLGTAFLIRRGVGSSVRVAVKEGKIRVTPRTKTTSGVTLTAGQIGEVTDSTVHVSALNELIPEAEWDHDQLVFRNTPLSTILATMTRWYGYQFRYSDSTLAHKPLTFGVSTQSSMKALAELEQVLQVNISVVGDTVTLIPQSPKRVKGVPRMRAYDVWTPTQEAGR